MQWLIRNWQLCNISTLTSFFEWVNGRANIFVNVWPRSKKQHFSIIWEQLEKFVGFFDLLLLGEIVHVRKNFPFSQKNPQIIIHNKKTMQHVKKILRTSMENVVLNISQILRTISENLIDNTYTPLICGACTIQLAFHINVLLLSFFF